jgi:hypothetical protein
MYVHIAVAKALAASQVDLKVNGIGATATITKPLDDLIDDIFSVRSVSEALCYRQADAPQ